MIKTNLALKPADLEIKLQRFWDLSGQKIHLIDKHYDEKKGSPVFTVGGKYSTRGWSPEMVRRVVWDNPAAFMAQSGKFALA